MSPNRYLKSYIQLFNSGYQSDTTFYIIHCKDNTFDMKTEWHPVPISQETAI